MTRLAIHYCTKKVKLSCLWVFMIMVLLNLTSHARPQVLGLGWNFPLSLSIPRRVSNLNWLFNCCQSWGNALWFPLLIQISTLFFSARANKFLSHKSIAQYHEYKLCFNIFWIINRTFHLKRFGYSSIQMRNPIMQRCLTI